MNDFLSFKSFSALCLSSYIQDIFSNTKVGVVVAITVRKFPADACDLVYGISPFRFPFWEEHLGDVGEYPDET